MYNKFTLHLGSHISSVHISLDEVQDSEETINSAYYERQGKLIEMKKNENPINKNQTKCIFQADNFFRLSEKRQFYC